VAQPYTYRINATAAIRGMRLVAWFIRRGWLRTAELVLRCLWVAEVDADGRVLSRWRLYPGAKLEVSSG